MSKRKKLLLWILIPLLLILCACALYVSMHWPELRARVQFGIDTVYSGTDADGDGVDDLTDLMRGARAYIQTQPEYLSAYYDGGYPPEGEGVCTDVIWHAMQAAGYDLKALVDADIAKHPSAYPLEEGHVDPNIDFRRVVNLKVFFDRCGCESLTTDVADYAQWQPGDIVVFEGHIGMISDRRNADGRPYLIHHAGYGPFEEDALDYKPVVAHYRWVF